MTKKAKRIKTTTLQEAVKQALNCSCDIPEDGYFKNDEGKNCWIRAFSKGFTFGDFTYPETKYVWFNPKGGDPMSDAKKLAQDEKTTERQYRVSIKSRATWEQLRDAPEDHPYLIEKSVKPYGVRVDGAGRLVVPMYWEGELFNLQTITGAGEKRFLPGGKKKECYYLVDMPEGCPSGWLDRIHPSGVTLPYPFGISDDIILILVEGFATGCSVYEATGNPVFVCFDAGNLKPVTEWVRACCKSNTIVIVGDWDESGTGQRCAREAALAVGGKVVLPARNSSGVSHAY
ncbi:toprim domain-containing protein [Methylobacter sp.]|uniref:toprim domain-containing protein n=1 Tax=Methylobacter sp. TaxID=2051955 RepID=UPI002FDE4A0D